MLMPWTWLDGRWWPHPKLAYWVRVSGPLWACRLGLWCERHKDGPAEWRWAMRPLWILVRLSGMRMEMREMPGGYTSARQDLPFEWTRTEMVAVLRSPAFVGEQTDRSHVLVHGLTTCVDVTTLTLTQRTSMANALIAAMVKDCLIQPDPVRGQWNPDHPAWTMTALGRHFRGLDKIIINFRGTTEDTVG